MPEPTTLLPEIEAPPVALAMEGSRRLRLMGLGVVLSVSLTHFVIGAVYSLFRVQNASQRYHSQIGVFDAVAAELISLLLLWFVLSANKLRWADIGWRAQGIDLLHGAGLIIGSRAAAVIATSLFQEFFRDYSGKYLQPRSGHGILDSGVSAATILLVFVNPFFEELIVRGYTMSEVMALGGSPNLAIFISVLAQMSYHVYQGFLRCVGLTAVFLLFSIYFSRTRRIGPVIIAHFWSDAWALIRLAS
jgi:membrane protease YdiL (CAAX protease family)